MAPLATVGILSIGEMGMGIAKLLVAHNYRVVTNIAGRRYAKAASPSLLCFNESLNISWIAIIFVSISSVFDVMNYYLSV